MTSNRALSIYLDDHLAGASAGVELARHTLASHKGTPAEAPLRRIAKEIADDRRTLRSIQEQLGTRHHAIKAAAGRVGEKISRLKLSPRTTKDADLTRLLELETLSLGIAGKLALWRALKNSVSAALDDIDLDDLIKRAEEQRAVVERYRLEAARAALDR